MLTKIIASAGVLLISLFVFFHLTPFALNGVDVAIQACAESDDIETVTEASWNGAFLDLTIMEAENCAFALREATVQRIGNHLFVRTSYDSPSGEMTACHCRHSAMLRIPNLRQQQVQVHVYSWP
jgi:hypothetical protein